MTTKRVKHEHNFRSFGKVEHTHAVETKRVGWFIVRTDMPGGREEISLPFRIEDFSWENAWAGIDEWNLSRVAIVQRELKDDEDYFTFPEAGR